MIVDADLGFLHKPTKKTKKKPWERGNTKGLTWLTILLVLALVLVLD